METSQLKEIVESIRRQTPRGWILMSPNSIGEVLITCAFARSLIEKYQYPITLCVRPEHVDMVNVLYPKRFAAVVPMNMELMRSFSTSGFIPKGHFDIDFPINLSPTYYGGDSLLEMHNLIYTRNGGSGLTLTDVWRHMLHLDWDSPMERPCLDFLNQENLILSTNGVAEGKYVLFQPGNNTNIPSPRAFWNPLEKMFLDRSFPLFANINGSMIVDRSLHFKGTKQLNLNILDALYLAGKSYMTVSGNNGLMLINVLMDYPSENRPLLHVITTDKYCRHYDKLNNDWDNAFIFYEGQPSVCVGSPEIILHSNNVEEWGIGSNLIDKEYEGAAVAIFTNDHNSRFHLNPSVNYNEHRFPKLLSFTKSM